jgi:hypothetical protein
MLKTFQFLCLTYLIGFANTGLACTPMAKIHLFNQIEHISILRNGTKIPKWATRNNRDLCAGDVVIVPKSLSTTITVEYYTNNPPKQEKLVAGDSHEISALSNPCGAWCKLLEEIKQLSHNLTHTESMFASNTPVYGRSENGELLYEIFMPLARGEGPDYEFFLLPQPGDIPLFWHGGDKPYQLRVKDAEGKVVVEEKPVKTNRYDLKLPSTAKGQRYELSLSCPACQKVYRKTLVFVAPPPLPLENLFQKLSALALDEDKNWRLEIWRQLAKLPVSKKREIFEQHLRLDDF